MKNLLGKIKKRDTPMPSKLAILHESAEKNDTTAQIKLGILYYWDYTHYGAIRDEKKAVKFWHLAAEQDNIHGCFFYAFSLSLGIGGIKKDSKLIQKYADQAKTGGLLEDFYQQASSGCMMNQYFLSLCYTYGIMVEKSFNHSKKWLGKAIEKGCEWAYVDLGMIYEDHMENAHTGNEKDDWRYEAKCIYR
ncbi:MAG: sel1 repeat family protein [Gammaproteobacteria bacterium]|nr:sel1 repeat family protein [Gammaproteobacteria bacterium]